MENQHTLRIDPFRMDKPIPAGRVDRNIGADLRKMNRRFNPVIEGVTNVDGRDVGKAYQCLSAGDGMMRMYDIGRFAELTEIIDDGNAARGNFLCRITECRGIYDGPMAAPQ